MELKNKNYPQLVAVSFNCEGIFDFLEPSLLLEP